jgi:NAD(P)H-flavin reductase
MTSHNPLVPQLFDITDFRCDTHDIFTLTLKPQNKSNFLFSPGQFNMLYAFGIGESAISISSSPLNHENITHTIRVVGSVTRNLQKLTTKDTIGIRGPFGNGWPIHQFKGKSIFLLAGGIGIAPLRSVIYALTSQRKDFADINLIYGTRTPQDLIYQNEFDKWRKDINLHVIVEHATTSWTGNVGVISQLIPKVIKDPENTIVLMCGPEIMMRFSYYSLRDEGINSKNIFLSMERNMQCAIGHCGHCQWGPFFICKDGPVMNYKEIEPFLLKKEL